MPTQTWQSLVADWTTAAAWSGNLVPTTTTDVVLALPGSTIRIASGETVAAHSIQLTTGTLALEATLAVAAGSTIFAGATLAGSGVFGGAGTLLNAGRIAGADRNGVLEITTAGFTNAGTVVAANAGIAAIFSANFTNLVGGTLTGGAYEADGALAAINIGNPNGGSVPITLDNASLMLNGPGAEIYAYNAATTAYVRIDDSLTAIAPVGRLSILGGRDYSTAKNLSDSGRFDLAGGTLTAAGFTTQAGATLGGFGTVATPIGNGGRIEAAGGTLTLAGGITDTGVITIDPAATLAFSGVYSQPITNAGTIEALFGTLRLAGLVAGPGGFLIQGTNAGTTLDLATAVAGPVVFNGVGATLRLDAPNSFAGILQGFGAGDTIDITGLPSLAASWSNGILRLTAAGVAVASLAVSGAYATAGFSVQPDGTGGSLVTVAGATAQDYKLEGPRWNTTTLTWSLATATDAGTIDLAHPFSSPIDPASASAAIIAQAFAAWSAATGMTFVPQPDTAQPADLRFGWGDLLGSSGEIGQATYSAIGNQFNSDLLIRLEDPGIDPLHAASGVIGNLVYAGANSSLYQVVLHEIGHALGLDHSTDPAAVMYPVAQGAANQVLNASDLAGAAALNADAACFAAGTRILTARGEVPVEQLRVGDGVPTPSGRLRRIGWIGRRRIEAERHPTPADMQPIRISTHAFAPGQPRRDLLLSPDHAVFADGVLIPVRYLANGDTLRPQPMREITYFHIELNDPNGQPIHDVLLAEGLPTESYLDTGNRGAFDGETTPPQSAAFARATWVARGCAPLQIDGPQQQLCRKRLLARAFGIGCFLTKDAVLF